MARKRRRYTDEFRASCIVMLEAAGYPETEGALARTQATTGIAHQTLKRWYMKENSPQSHELVPEKELDLKALLEKELAAALNEMEYARPDASYRDLATALGIIFDKLRLLENKSTENIAHELSISQRSERIAALLDEGRTRRAGQVVSDD